MKRRGNLIEKIADWDNLYEAFRKASRGKRRKAEVKRYAEKLDDNLRELRRQILSGKVQVGAYRHFTIYEPKERIICAAEFRERVLHHAIINVCHDIFDSTLIDSTYATRRGKGLYAAIEKAVYGMTRYKYTLKLDVRKYYDSIDHEVLKTLLRSKYKDKKLLGIFDRIIDSFDVSDGKGLPIGNLTSQYFANFYLSTIDHYAKEVLRVPIYIRYMDDMLMAAEEKDFLRDAERKLGRMVGERLKLRFKPPVYRCSNVGQNFLGYKILPYRYELSGRSKRRYRMKLLLYNRMLENGKWSEREYNEHILPLLAFVSHAVSSNFRKACMDIR